MKFYDDESYRASQGLTTAEVEEEFGCNFCWDKKRKKEKDKYMNWDNKLGGLTISDTQYSEKKKNKEENVHPDLWVVRNLRNYGNCYINGKHDLDYIEEQLGYKVRVITLAEGNILEVIR